MEALPRFRGESSERTWLYRIAHNTSISYLTTNKRRRARESNASAITEPASENDSPEAEAIDRQKQQRLWGAIRGLPVSDRQVVVLYLEGMSAAESRQ